MKNRILLAPLVIGLGVVVITTFRAPAQTTVSTPTAPTVQPGTEAPPAKLPYGVEDILKLSHAQVSEDIIINYVQNSGTVYNLNPQDIVYLRNQGVSGNVINAMLDQRKKVIAEAAAQAVAQPPVQPEPVPMYPDTSGTAPAPSDTQAPASSVYVIPYPQATFAYDGGYSLYPYYSAPYYGGYYGPYYSGYCGPVVSFGYGGGYYHGGWGHGNWGHGGSWGHSGGWNGGGHSHGGFHR